MPPAIPSGLPQIPNAISIQQKQGSAIMIWAIGAFCIFGWEYLICLPQEYKRIWKQPMNTSSVLYIANRYFGLLQLSFVMTLQASIWSHNVCKHMYLWEPVGALISTVLSQMILGGRVYAIFGQNKIIAFILGFTLVVEVVINGISISTTSPPPLFEGPVGSGPPCSAVTGPFGWLLVAWTIPLFYDTMTFLLTAWKAYDFWKREIDTPLFNIIWRDGLLYFFAVFSMNTANVIIFSTVTKTLRPVNLTPTLVFEIILSCRLVLNLRSAGSGSVSKPRIPPWSDNSKIQTSSAVLRDPFHSTDHTNSPAHKTEMKIEPNRRPIDVKVASTWSVV